MTLEYSKLLKDMVCSLVLYPEDVEVLFSVDENKKEASAIINVNENDLGRVIGKNGNTISAIRSILYAVAKKDSLRLKIEVTKK